ncbi:MAG TPA: DUF4190 domain-containing protein [Ktedonobacterales bacterium]
MSNPYGFDPNQTTEYDPTAMDDFYADTTQDYPYPNQQAYPPPPPMRPNPLSDQSTILKAQTRAPAKAPARVRPAPVPRPRVTPGRRESMARASLWLGIISAAVSLIPVCGIVALFPAAMGIAFGWLGRNSRRRGMALAGMLLSMLAIAAALAVVI